MGKMWIIDVLGDLRTFAELNGLETLAQELDRTSDVAKAELASSKGTAQTVLAGHVAGNTETDRKT